MRRITRTSLFATVAAAALFVGPASDLLNSNASGSASIVPVQFGTSAEAQARISVGIFFDRLQPHGRWVRHQSHGYVFIPANVGNNWRPYTEGRWVFTNDHGWYWVSDEPFGWATYHYGRWGYSRAYGWFWVPGNVWAPAWVTWRTGGDVIGWAPLAPERRGYAWGTPTQYRPAVAESWVFVELRYVTAPTLVQYVTPISEIPVYLTRATNSVDIRVEQNIVINQPIEITQIQNIVVEPVQTLELTFTDDPEQASAGGETAFRAELSEEEPAEAPPEAAESREEVGDTAVLEETLDEVPAEAEAPSANEVEDEVTEEQPAEQLEGSQEEPVPVDATDDAEPGAGNEAPAAEADAPAPTARPTEEGAVDNQAEQPSAEEPASDEPASEEPAEEAEVPAEAPAEGPAASEEPASQAAEPAEEEAPEPPAEEQRANEGSNDGEPRQPEEQACPDGQETC